MSRDEPVQVTRKHRMSHKRNILAYFAHTRENQQCRVLRLPKVAEMYEYNALPPTDTRARTNQGVRDV